MGELNRACAVAFALRWCGPLLVAAGILSACVVPLDESEESEGATGGAASNPSASSGGSSNHQSGGTTASGGASTSGSASATGGTSQGISGADPGALPATFEKEPSRARLEACVATWEAVGQEAPFGSVKLVKAETGEKANYSWLLPEVADLSGKVLKFRMRAEAPLLVKPWLRTTRLSTSDVWGKYANGPTLEVGTEWVDLEFDLDTPAWADPTFDPATAFHVGIEWWMPTVPLWIDEVWVEDAP